MKGQNFQIVAAAQDTGGEAAAGKFYEAAKATYATLIDTQHLVSSLYGMVNVPTGVWIDEQGRMVRPLETAYTMNRTLSLGGKTTTILGEPYVAGLRDWVAKGAASQYAMKPGELTAALKSRTPQEMEADASFRLAVWLHDKGKDEQAAQFFQRAQQLNPDSWNYHRQEWSFTPKEAGAKWLKKYQSSDKPYYDWMKPPEEK